MRQATPQFHYRPANLITKRDMVLMMMHRRGRAASVVVSPEQATTRAVMRSGCACGGGRCADGVVIVSRSPEVDASATGNGSGGVGCAGGVAVAVMHFGLCVCVL